METLTQTHSTEVNLLQALSNGNYEQYQIDTRIVKWSEVNTRIVNGDIDTHIQLMSE